MKCDNELDKEIYIQSYENFRALNDLMWKIPVFSMTVTGGIWFGIASFNLSYKSMSLILFLLSAINFVFIPILIRLRWIMNQLLRKIVCFEKRDLPRGYMVVTLFSIILLLVSIGNFIIALNPEEYFPKPTNSSAKQVDNRSRYVPNIYI